MNIKIFENLAKIAEDIPINSETNRYRLSAAVVRRNTVIAYGTNSMKTDPLQGKYRKNECAVYMHAEISAIKNSLRRIDIDTLKKCDIYVCRVKRDSTKKNNIIWGNAKPCSGCARAISDFEFKNVYFTCDSGEIGIGYTSF